MKPIYCVLFLCFCCLRLFGQLPKGKIIFKSQKDGKYALFSVHSDGSNLKQLTSWETELNLSDACGSRIVYLQDGGYTLIVADTNGSMVRKLSFDYVVRNPHWQPDGKLIVFRRAKRLRAQIALMDTGGNRIRIFKKDCLDPSWNADGRKMLFMCNFDVYMIDLETEEERRLTHIARWHYNAEQPFISPDGTRIACTIFRNESGKKAEAMISDLVTGKLKIIANCDQVSWTGDSRYILCSGHSDKQEDSRVGLVNVETGERTLIPYGGNSCDAVWLDH